MLNKIARTLKLYLPLIMCCLFLVSISPWVNAGPPLPEQLGQEIIEPTELLTEENAEPIIDNEAGNRAQPVVSKDKEQPAQSASEPPAPSATTTQRGRFSDRSRSPNQVSQLALQPNSKTSIHMC